MTRATSINSLYSDIQNANTDSVEERKLDKLLTDCIGGKLLFNYSSSVLRAVPADIVRIVSQSKHLASNALLRSTLINIALSCEKRCSGSGFVFLLLLSSSTKISDDKKMRVNIADLQKIIQSYYGNGTISKLLQKICHKHGFEYNIKFINGPVENLKLRATNSSQFYGNIDPAFSKDKIEGKHHVFCTRGKIETIGEVDNLLQWSQKNNQKIILLANSFSPDVAQTLEHNYGEKLHVVPFIFDDKEQDITSICNQVVDTDTGIRFNNIDYGQSDAFDIVIKRDRFTVNCEHGAFRHIDIVIPNNAIALNGIIEDRLLAGISITKNALLTGFTELLHCSDTFYVPNNCLQYAIQAKNTYSEIANASCIVSLG